MGCQVWRQGDERQENYALHGVLWGGLENHMCSAVAGQGHLVFDLTCPLYSRRCLYNHPTLLLAMQKYHGHCELHVTS